MGSIDLHRLVAAEQAADVAQRALQDRELSRHRGVAWSGMAAEPHPLRSPEAIEARARARLARSEAWRIGDGAFVSAVADCQAAARAAFTVAERARAGSARGESAEWRLQILEDLASQARALTAGVRQARRAAAR